MLARRFLTSRLLFPNVQFVPVKNIVHESSASASRSQEEIKKWLETNQVSLSGQDIPTPVFEFCEAGFPKQIVDVLIRNYQKPSVIQSISWPVALAGRDMISIAKTGSGKTLGFMLPGIVHTLKVPRRPPGAGPTALVLAPTRELAQQVEKVTREYAPIMQRNTVCLFGGVSRINQEISLRGGVDICISTPGRLLDFLAAGATNLSHCSYLVLDEADRMLDMGFEPQIRDIVSQIKNKRQTLMFSATWPEEVRQLASDFHTDPVFLNVGSLELAANHNIEQIVEVTDEIYKPERLSRLLETLMKEKGAKILIFAETKKKCEGLARAIMRIGWRATAIHGDRSQLQRDTALRDFENGRIQILVATDVAARGLDVNDIKTVINYDYPLSSEMYVHRIGRTGRCDKEGVAYTFFTPSNSANAADLVKVLEEANQEVPPALRALIQAGGAKIRPNYENYNKSTGYFDNRSGYGHKRQSGYSNNYSSPRHKRSQKW